jgi:cytochrome c biogenesis protein CcmG/thiol:disulfide interchange protein DsbE
MDWKDDDAQAMSWLAQLGNPYQVVAADRDGREAINWGVYEAPESFLVNPQGIIVYKVLGEITQETWEHELLPRVQGRQAAK